MSKPKKSKANPLIIYLFISMTILTVVTIGLIKFIDILPNRYFGLLIGIFAIIEFVFSCLLFSKKLFIKVLGGLTTTFYIFVLIIAIIYEINTIDFLKKIGKSEYITLNYKLVSLKSSDINNLSDVTNKKLGIVEDTKEEVTTHLYKKSIKKYETYDHYSILIDKLENKNLDVILLEDSMLSILKDENPKIGETTKVIYEFSVDLKQKTKKHTKNVTKKPFNIYISGIDTYGKINSVSRTDVNMILTVNPKTFDILVTSIPRDYYVELYGYNEFDKLTHSGIYSIDTSIGTIEKMLGIKIDYYVKVNFTSLIKMVDTLGGIDVESEYEFVSQDGYKFYKGTNKMNGAKALSFSRERKSLPDGDRSRNVNQQAVLTAIINKLMVKSNLTKYNDLLKSLKPSIVTNMSDSQITNFVKMQIDKNPKWNIEYYLLDGEDGYEYTYSYSKHKLYVMIPDEKSLRSSSDKINEILLKEDKKAS